MKNYKYFMNKYIYIVGAWPKFNFIDGVHNEVESLYRTVMYCLK